MFSTSAFRWVHSNEEGNTFYETMERQVIYPGIIGSMEKRDHLCSVKSIFLSLESPKPITKTNNKHANGRKGLSTTIDCRINIPVQSGSIFI